MILLCWCVSRQSTVNYTEYESYLERPESQLHEDKMRIALELLALELRGSPHMLDESNDLLY